MFDQFAEKYLVLTTLLIGVAFAILYYRHLSKKQNTSFNQNPNILDRWLFTLVEFKEFFACAKKSLVNTKLCSNQVIRQQLNVSVNEMYHKTIFIGCKTIKEEGYSISRLVKEKGGEV